MHGQVPQMKIAVPARITRSRLAVTTTKSLSRCRVDGVTVASSSRRRPRRVLEFGNGKKPRRIALVLHHANSREVLERLHS